jgi:UDP-glucose 4-epimerase
MKTFVVTGCNGFIGSHMCYELRQSYPDCHIIGVDKVDKPHLRHLYDVYSPIDISCNPLYTGAKHIDCIFHFAAYISVEEGERNAWSYYRNNIGATFGAIDFARRYGVKNFIFSSTAAVYGDSINPILGQIQESSKLQPTSVYGKSKAICENILQDTDNMRIAILRYFNACGRNVEANLYEEHDPETHLIPILAKNKKAVIYGDTWATKDGTCVRDYVHVIDICLAHICAYEYISNDKGSNIVCNIGTGKGYSVKEVVDKVNEIIHNGEMEIVYEDRRNGDVPYLVADTTTSETILEFKPENTLDDIIKSMKLSQNG